MMSSILSSIIFHLNFTLLGLVSAVVAEKLLYKANMIPQGLEAIRLRVNQNPSNTNNSFSFDESRAAIVTLLVEKPFCSFQEASFLLNWM